MGNFQDWSVGISAAEATFGATTTIARHLEFTEPKPFTVDPGIKQGAGIRVGSRVARSARRATTIKQASGDITVEAFSKGQGLLYAAGMGSGSSTLVSAGLYQQLHTFADSLPSHNIQFGVPNAAGTVSPITYRGCTVSSFEMGGAIEDIATLKTSWDARDWDTATAYVTPSYPTGGQLFTVKDITIYGGTLTAPTATALASALTPIAGVKSFKVTVNNQVLTSRFYANAGGLKDRQLPGTRQPAIELDVDYVTNDLRDAWLGQSALTLVATMTAGTDVLQVVVPEMKLDGDLPEGGPDVIASQAIKASVLDNLTAAQPLWIVTRTSDTAL